MLSNVAFDILTMLFTCSINTLDIETASEAFFSGLNLSDSIYVQFTENKQSAQHQPAVMDSLFISLLASNPNIFALTYINSIGETVIDINRDSDRNTIRNVKGKDWFQIPLTTAKPFTAGVVTANSRLCFLRTYPIYENSVHHGILAVLTDLQILLNELNENYPFPFTLFYNDATVYQSSPHVPFSLIRSPDFQKIELLYYDKSKDINNNFLNETRQTHLPSVNPLRKTAPILPWCLTAFTIIASLCVLFFKPKIKRDELIAFEYNRLPQETRKFIYDRAISQLYCEIKRQIETHETNRIQQEVREQLYYEMRQKIIGHKQAMMR